MSTCKACRNAAQGLQTCAGRILTGWLVAEYNRYHHIVGASLDKLLLTGPVVRGDSALASMPTGPYGAATAIEVRFENNKSRPVKQFRFLQKSGERYEPGDYSTWQKDDMGPPYEVENTSDWHSQLLLSSENFDSTEWKIKIALRWTQIWNLLHAYPLIGMDKIQIQKLLGKGDVDDTRRDANVVSYRLGEQTDLITSLPRLELKYHNNHVIAFQVEN